MWNYIFYLPGVLFIVSGLPQTFRLLKRRSSADISIIMYTLTVAGIALVVIDAWRSRAWSIFYSNLASLLITGFNWGLVIWYRYQR